MPQRISRWLSRQAREKPLTANLIVLLLVVVPGTFIINHEQNCAQSFAASWYSTQVPRVAAQDEVDEADALVWVRTQIVLTQHATQKDYAALREAIRQRNRLWADLEAKKREHPIPPPPSKFC